VVGIISAPLCFAEVSNRTAMTNFSYIHTRRGRYAEFQRLVGGHPLALALAFAVDGELKVLAIRAQWGEERRKALDAAIAACVVLPNDARIVDKWAEMHGRFLGRLKDGRINDLWIVACCLIQVDR
jgi:predicted nucleic acid-binding protein